MRYVCQRFDVLDSKLYDTIVWGAVTMQPIMEEDMEKTIQAHDQQAKESEEGVNAHHPLYVMPFSPENGASPNVYTSQQCQTGG